MNTYTIKVTEAKLAELAAMSNIDLLLAGYDPISVQIAYWQDRHPPTEFGNCRACGRGDGLIDGLCHECERADEVACEVAMARAC